MVDQAESLRKLFNVSNRTSTSSINKEVGQIARVITVTSGKGGVGKTNFTVNLALALANMGQRVLIIDADLGMANVDVILGCISHYNLMHLLDPRYSINDIMVDGPRNIKFMSGGSGIQQFSILTEREFHQIINKIITVDHMFDFILIDTGAGLNNNILHFVLAADEVIIITTPEPTAVTDAYAMMKAYTVSHGSGNLKLVINRTMDNQEAITVAEKLNKVALRFLNINIETLGYIQEDINVVKAIKKQTPLMLAYPNSLSARCIERIAGRIIYGEEFTNSRGIKGFFSRLFNMH